MPKVSICVPVYNVEQYIGRCIESIQSQTLHDIEIIVVNDCTKDNSMHIVEEYAKQDCRIRIINHDYNKGLMWARKSGYMAAKSDYITFCDSDDTLCPESVELLYRKAISTNADVVAGNIRYISVNGEEKVIYNELRYGSDKESVYKSLLQYECGHNLCSKIFKKELLQNYNYFTFENFINGEDGCLFYQVVENSKCVVNINNIVYNYYQNIESSSQVRLNENGIKSIALLNKIRVELCSKYSALEALLYRFVFRVFNEQLMQGYGTMTMKYVREYNLCEFVDIKTAYCYFSKVELLKLILKRHLYKLYKR